MEATIKTMQGSRDRAHFALVIAKGKVYKFQGETIPGMLAVKGNSYEKNGKWSNSTYTVELAGGVKLIQGHMGWETGTFTEGLSSATGTQVNSWVECANALGVDMEECQRFIGETYPKAAARMDKRDADLAALDEATSDGCEEVRVSFGSPTRRLQAAGYWSWPIVVTNPEGSVVAHLKSENNTYTPREGDPVKVLQVTHRAGPGGGYMTVHLAIPVGCKAHHSQEDYEAT